jgi:Nucleopolyhedrovirus protein of unknown function (DUF884)
MNVILYCPADNRNLLTFNMVTSINSMELFLFQTRSTDDSTDGQSAKLVSGHEKGRRTVSITLRCEEELLSKQHFSSTYLVTCFRAPFVITKLLSYNIWPLLMFNENETQIWHVIAVKKRSEPIRSRRIRGLMVCVNGIETFIEKETISLSGNLPVAFIAALLKQKRIEEQDLNILKVLYPSSIILNNEDVKILE